MVCRVCHERRIGESAAGIWNGPTPDAREPHRNFFSFDVVCMVFGPGKPLFDRILWLSFHPRARDQLFVGIQAALQDQGLPQPGSGPHGGKARNPHANVNDFSIQGSENGFDRRRSVLPQLQPEEGRSFGRVRKLDVLFLFIEIPLSLSFFFLPTSHESIPTHFILPFPLESVNQVFPFAPRKILVTFSSAEEAWLAFREKHKTYFQNSYVELSFVH